MPRMARGPDDGLVALEREILDAAIELTIRGQDEFHGYGMAELLEDERHAHRRTGFGSLYRALARLEDMGFLNSRWSVAESQENAKPRRLYRLTPAGMAAVTS